MIVGKDMILPNDYAVFIRINSHLSYLDLLSHVFMLVLPNARDWSVDKICTVFRGATYLQTQPEYAYETLRRFYDYADIVDGVKGLKNKNKYASKYSHRVPDVHSTLIVNYMGREDWGSMTDYVERAHIITDAHLLFEILDVGDNFCISLMQMNKKEKYFNSFCRIPEEESIPYKIIGMFHNHLPISKVENAPVSKEEKI